MGFISILDRFTPSLRDSDPMTQSRARFLAAFMLVNLVFLGLLLILSLLRRGIPQTDRAIIILALLGHIVLYTVLLAILRRLRTPDLAGHAILIFNFVLISGMAILADAAVSASLVQHLYVLAILPFLFLGFRAGLVWGILGGLAYAVIRGSKRLGFLAEGVLPAGGYLRLEPLFMLALYPTIFVAGLIYEGNNRQQSRQLMLERNRFMDEANRDRLTGLANRNRFDLYFPLALEECGRGGGCVGLLYVDLDEFKPINDRYGHHVGDEVLRIIGARMRESVRDGDLVARMGGDEFAVVYRHVRDVPCGANTARKLLTWLEEPIALPEGVFRIRASAGLVCYPHPNLKPDAPALMELADQLMYRSKQQGRGLVVYAESPDGESPGF